MIKKKLLENIKSLIKDKNKKNKYSKLINKSLELYHKNEYKQSLLFLNEIKENIIKHHDIYYFEAIIYSYLGNNVKVIELCKKGLNLKETYYLYDRIAISYHELDEYSLALEMFDKAIEIDDSIFELYYDKAITLSDLYTYDEAIELFDIAISINPNYPKAYYEKGYSLFEIKEYNQAFESYKKYVDLTNKTFCLPISSLFQDNICTIVGRYK